MPARAMAVGLFCALGLLASLWLAAPSAEAFQPRVSDDFFGVSAPELVERARDGDTAGLDRHAAAMQRAGIDWARITFDWRLVEPRAPGSDGSHSYDWSWTDRFVAALARHGIETVPTAWGTPAWARDFSASVSGCAGNAGVSASHMGAFADYTEALIERYGRDGAFWRQNPDLPYHPMRSIEVWNEPNWAGFWCPGPDPEAFADLLASAATEIREADAKAKVMIGGLVTIKQDAHFADGSLQGMRTDEFLRRMMARQPSLDGLLDEAAIHLYESDPSESLSLLGWSRRVLDNVGLGDLKLNITEFGWPTKGAGAVSEQRRAKDYTELVDKLARTDCRVSGIAAHSWYSFESDPTNPVDWFGIADPTTAELYPAGQAYADEIALFRGQGSAPAPRKVISVCGGTSPDQDGDGTPDEQDDYPLDPDRDSGANEPSPHPEGLTGEQRTMPARAGDDFFGATDVALPADGPGRQAQYDAMKDAGLGQIREELQWDHIESAGGGQPSAYQWTETDQRVVALASRGLRMVPTAIDPRQGLPADPAQIDDVYAAFTAAVARRYGSQGTFWDENGQLDRSLAARDYEVWQAGNASWGAWDGSPSAADYARTYARTRAAVLGADPRARVLASLVDHADNGGYAGDFLRSMVAARPQLRGGIDGVYVMANSARNASQAEHTVAEVRQALDDTGNGDARIELGFGASTRDQNAISEGDRAAMISDIASAMPRTDCGVSGVFAYAWATRSEDDSNSFEWYGIASLADAGLLPSGEAYRSVIRSFTGYGTEPAPRPALHPCFGQAPDGDGDGVPDAADPAPLDATVSGTPPKPPSAPTFSSKPPQWSPSAAATLGYGTARAESYQCKLDGQGWQDCGSSLDLSGLDEDEHEVSVRGVDALGIVGPAAEYSWTVDTRAPITSIDSGPDTLVVGDGAHFTVGSNEPGSRFSCRLDSGPWQACDSTPAFGQLSDGYHVFRVAAIDRAGNTDPSYAAQTFETRTVPRVPSISAISGVPGQRPTAHFDAAWSASFECRYDGAEYAPCSGDNTDTPARLLSQGQHRFYVRGVGPTGKSGPAASAPVSVVDTTKPETSIDSPPRGPVLSDSVRLQLASDEDATFWCHLDAGGWSPCPADGRFENLLDGEHQLAVLAVDVAGNTDPSPAELKFTIRTQPAPATITAGPAQGSESAPLPRFTFRAQYAAAMQCRFDSAAFHSCSEANADRAAAPLAAGEHTFAVRGVGGTGKLGAPASRAFTVTGPPKGSSGPSGPTGPSDPTGPSEPTGSTPRCHGRSATIVGSSRADKLIGTGGRDVIVARGGADVIRSRGGNDLVCAGGGRDVVRAGSGSDRIFGDGGRDRLAGGKGRDRLAGGPGRDRLNGGRGRDRCRGDRHHRSSCERG